MTSLLSRDTSLGACEEGDGLAQAVPEDLGAQVVDEPLADAGGEVPLAEPGEGIDDGEHGDDEREDDDELPVALGDAIVDDPLEQQRRDDDEEGVEHDECEEDGDLGPVRAGVGEDAPPGALGELALGDAAITRERARGHPRGVS
jgi:hypothetical protein